MWTSVISGRVWTSVDQCGPVWTSVDQCGPVWTSVDKRDHRGPEGSEGTSGTRICYISGGNFIAITKLNNPWESR